VIAAVVRRHPARVAEALGRLRPDEVAILSLADPGPPHEWDLARRGLLGRSERGRPHRAEVEAAAREQAEANGVELAEAAASQGFQVSAVRVVGPGPPEIERALAGLDPALVVLEAAAPGPLPPHLRKVAERWDTLLAR
jgi:hypothetical protein